MSATLGKRKEREEDVKQENTKSHGSTLFVSNLPYTATSVDLQTLFSDIAPVRSAFVVTEQGTGVSKGVGYVSFSIREDAQAAYETLSKEGINLAGRSLRVQWAENKPKEKGEKVKKETKEPQRPRIQHPKAPHDPLAIRTIVVSGLPSSVDSKVLWKKFRKYPGAEKVDWPIKIENEDHSDIAHVLFDTPAHALDAVNKLHAHVFKGSLLSVALKKRIDNLQKPATSKSTKTATSAAPSHASRLIIRNIPFHTTEQDLRAVFLPHGPIHSIHIPTEKKDNEDNSGEGGSTGSPSKKPRTKGFAFVWMMSKKDAERAMEKCNGMVVRAGIAEGLVGDKQKRKKQRRVEKKMKMGMNKENAEEEAIAEENDAEDDDDQNAEERVIAVDWALSKDKWEEEKAKIEAAGEEEDVEMKSVSSGSTSDDDSDDGSSASESDDSGSEDDAVGVHEDDGESSEEGGSSDDDDEEGEHSDAPVKPQLPTPDAGTTLFVRNVPFTATDDELRALFRAFGPLRYARITMDPATGRSRGTGFACFWNKEDADKVIEQSDLLRAETTGTTTAPKKNPFSMPSILTPDPSSMLARTLVLQGRTLDVVRAVNRDQAGKLKEEGEKRREKADKRNMYLLREGVILPNTPAAETLPPAELERRIASFNARKALLKSNPSLYISKTRLSIRQIPILVTERMLKRLALHAVKTFNAEVKNGDRAGLTIDELTEVVSEGAEEDQAKGDEVHNDKKQQGTTSKTEKKGQKKDPPRKTGVKQAKIVRQHERVDAITGKGRSKGYGFLEMNKHSDALRVLRWANNNPSIGALFQEWWVDELKDLIKVEKRKDEKDAARIKRMEEEIEKGSLGKSRGTLIVEFSIENVQVVQRRTAHQSDKDRNTSKPRTKPQEKISLPKAEDPSPKKKPRLSQVKSEGGEEKSPKTGQAVGFLIGRKRKEKKMGKSR